MPEVEGPVLAVGGDLGKEAEGGVGEVTGLGVLGLRLEDLHFAPEGRFVSNGAILLRGLELLLLAGTVLKVESAERDEGGMVCVCVGRTRTLFRYLPACGCLLPVRATRLQKLTEIFA